jgi:uncharacterized protein (DUF433 family)
LSNLHALATGFYTVPEAARLIRVGSARRIYGWLRGYPDRDIGPLLNRDYQPVGDEEEVSFLDLMEIRFVMFFREKGVKIASLRKASDTLRKDFSTEHPFALSKVLLRADKADVYVVEVLQKSAIEAGDVRLRSLVTNNYVMEEIIRQSILPGVEFDTSTSLAKAWKPIPDSFPDIIVNPRRAFGQPTISAGVPTGTLYGAWKTEHENADIVADWFGVSAREVMDAIRFEQTLDEFASRRAA